MPCEETRPDQACDDLAWAIEICKRVNSACVRLLFDIYQVQITDCDICRNIQEALMGAPRSSFSEVGGH